MEHSIDREKVIEALHCRGQDLMIDLPACDGCDYQIQLVNRMGCDYRQICRDALALLKEQEPVPLIHSAEYEEYWDIENICPKCNARWVSLAEDHFCPQCGQAVKQND